MSNIYELACIVSDINGKYDRFKAMEKDLNYAVASYVTRMLFELNADNKNYKFNCNIDLKGKNVTIDQTWLEDGICLYSFEHDKIEFNDLSLDDKFIILNYLYEQVHHNKLLIVKDRHDCIAGAQLEDGRIISRYDHLGNRYLADCDWVIDLKKEMIVRRAARKSFDDPIPITEYELSKGFTTLSKLIRENKAKWVECFDQTNYQREDDNETVDDALQYFHSKGFNVSRKAVKYCFDTWKKFNWCCGYRDEETGYHLNSIYEGEITATTLDYRCKSWQTTYRRKN